MNKDQFDILIDNIDKAVGNGHHYTIKHLIAKAIANSKVTEDWASCLTREAQAQIKKDIHRYYLGSEI